MQPPVTENRPCDQNRQWY